MKDINMERLINITATTAQTAVNVMTPNIIAE
jgi:hypothetical protein